MADQATGANAAGYRVLARKYRPKSFADLIGQDALVRTLTNAFATGRIAQAYMLTGVRGVGKTTTARLIARALNYPSGPTVQMIEITPQCEAILESRHMDVIEMDAASNTGVDNMREIIEQVRYAPVSVRTKVYIIDEVHMLSKSAFNALLKTLEEPPPHVKFIFATTEIRKVPVTILSRCQRFDLKRLDASLLTQHYGNICKLEQVEAEDEALRLIARAAEGSVRDGLSLLDQAIAFGDGHVKTADVTAMLGLIDRSQVIDLFDAMMAGDAARAIGEIQKQYEGGGEPETIIADLADFTHWVTRLKVVPQSAQSDNSRTEDEKKRGSDYAGRIGMAHLSRAWQMLLKGYAETQQAANPIQAAEMVLIRLCHAATLPQGEELVKLVKDAKESRDASPRPAPSSVVENLRRDSARSESPTGSSRVETDGNLAKSTAPTAQASEVMAEAAPPRSISKFSDIIALATEKRDIILKSNLERLVRPVSVSDGKLEIALEPDAHPAFPGEISRKLESWTGRRWMVMLAKSGGEAPLARQRKDAKDQGFRDANQHPDIQAFLKKFPGSEVIDVRLPPPPEPTPAPMEDSDEESR